MYSLHTYFPSPVQSPGGRRKEIQEEVREVSGQITQFGNNKGIFCPGTHTLWRAICCQGSASLLIPDFSLVNQLQLSAIHWSEMGCKGYACYEEGSVCKEMFYEVQNNFTFARGRLLKCWEALTVPWAVRVPLPGAVTMQILIELHSPDLFLSDFFTTEIWRRVDQFFCVKKLSRGMCYIVTKYCSINVFDVVWLNGGYKLEIVKGIYWIKVRD